MIDSLMADIIEKVASDEAFRKDMSERIGGAVDTSEYEKQIEILTGQIRNKTKTLKRKSLAIDDFDWDIDNADTVYDALNADYDRLNKEVVALQKSLGEVEELVKGIQGHQVTKNKVVKFILEFGTVFKKMSEIDKKELARSFIEKVEIHPEEKEDGSLIKSVTFRFPIFKGKDKLEEADINSRTNGKHVETVVLLSRI